jgi:hypothetical protein
MPKRLNFLLLMAVLWGCERHSDYVEFSVVDGSNSGARIEALHPVIGGT